jgi:hypothetical protein
MQQTMLPLIGCPFSQEFFLLHRPPFLNKQSSILHSQLLQFYRALPPFGDSIVIKSSNLAFLSLIPMVPVLEVVHNRNGGSSTPGVVG